MVRNGRNSKRTRLMGSAKTLRWLYANYYAEPNSRQALSATGIPDSASCREEDSSGLGLSKLGRCDPLERVKEHEGWTCRAPKLAPAPNKNTNRGFMANFRSDYFNAHGAAVMFQCTLICALRGCISKHAGGTRSETSWQASRAGAY